MKLLLSALATLLLPIAGVLSNSFHQLNLKAPPRIYAECRQYLGYRTPRPNWQFPDKCENWCGQLQTRMIDNGEIRPARQAFYFDSNLTLPDMVDRVDRCAHQVLECDKCTRSDRYFTCFTAVSSVNFDLKQYIPKTDLQRWQTVTDCAGMLQIAPDELGRIYREGLLESPRGRCLVRCFLIRLQLYSEVFGVDPQRVILQMNQVEKYDALREQAISCSSRLQQQYLDRCTLAARIAAECFGKELWDIINESVIFLCPK